MSNKIIYGGKSYEEIEVERLNKFLLDCELASHQDIHYIPVIILDRKEMSLKGLKSKVTISRGLHGGLFSICEDHDGSYNHEEFYDEASISSRRIWVPKDYLKSLINAV